VAGLGELQGSAGVLTSPELRLAIACCRERFTPVESAGVESLLTGVDWPRFVRLARFHRIQGLVWPSLSPMRERLPADCASDLADDAQAIAAANLRAAAESSDLLAQFMRQGIDVLFIKGLTLGMLAYGNITAKSGVDVDLLIPSEKLIEAAELLDKRGYLPVEPAGDFSAEKLLASHRWRKESVWVHPAKNLQVDLHTALADHPMLIPSIGLNSPRQTVEIAPGIAVPTLGLRDLLTYLSVHGAASAWFRLKWITDFAALLKKSNPDEVEAFYRSAPQLRAGPAPALALRLADEIYGGLAGLPEIKRKLQRDRTSRRLCRIYLRRLARTEPAEPTSRRFGTVFFHAIQFALLPGWRFKLAEFYRQCRSALG
jgi:hypothetical protein